VRLNPARPVVAILVASLVLFAGCTGDKDAKQTNQPARSVPGPLDASVKQFATTSYRFTVKATQGTLDGGFDPAANVLNTKLTATDQGATVTVETLVVDADHYVKITGLPYPGFDGSVWYALDAGRLKSLSPLGISDLRDPTGARALIAAATKAQQAGDRRYSGTVDLTTLDTWGPVDAADIQSMREKAKSVPFEATLDEKGRLATLKVVVPAYGAVAEDTVTATYREFGGGVKIARPSDGVQDAPEEVYQLLGV
jgi:hypothetical protein